MQFTSLSRREMLAASAAAAALAGLPSFLRAEDKVADPFGGFPIGVQSYTFRNFKAPEAVRHAQGLGLKYMEFFSAHWDPKATAEQTAEMQKLLATAGIKANAHGVNGFTKDHEANKKLFAFAKAAGLKNLTADPTPDSFDSLDTLCEEYGIRIAIHNHGPNHRYNHLEDVAKAVEGHHKLIGACIDTGHTLRSNEDPVKWAAELGPRVFGLHLKDVKDKQDRTVDVVLGTAHLDLVALFQTLTKIKFPADGVISVEYESNPANPVEDVKTSLVAVKAAIAKAKA